MEVNHNYHLTYCSNIHPGEKWAEVFKALRVNLPAIRHALNPGSSMGIGLRLSNEAALELTDNEMTAFMEWMGEEGFYVFTMNGFPYGGFHDTVVKDKVYSPDWTTPERLTYTLRLFDILNVLLPEGLDGGISTSPVSYKPWFQSDAQRDQALEKGAQQMALVAQHLYQLKVKTGKSMHLDIEPEPDCLIENTAEVVDFFNRWMLPIGISLFKENGLSAAEAEEAVRTHIQLCYDICHFAVAFEKPAQVIETMEKEGIRIGKVQVSAALGATFSGNGAEIIKTFSAFDEKTYLHQVKALNETGEMTAYPDLKEGIEAYKGNVKEWRTHFHVPIFLEEYGLLKSTQQDIIEVAEILKKKKMTNHLEVETYTWGVLPKDMQVDIQTSIIRELEWFKSRL